MTLDGAVIEEYTQGINAPTNGQQGYFCRADSQVPYPNLEYISAATAAAALGVVAGSPELVIANSTSQVLTFTDNFRLRYTGSTTCNITANLTGAKDGKRTTILFPIGSITTFTVSTSIDPTSLVQLAFDSALDAYLLTAEYLDGGCVLIGMQKVIDV